ncbi:glycosyltransferase [Pontibacter sp. Tf4]|uniref:glycosyltransferase n=1 Tax=Pontibacter sp. Tf4 TaxID=2761620 RepID=UPI001625AEEA|nr:glycosyltransferase [Pontibacter sp. Tf4]MBB6610838.1 glycosyltransferase [Pontibacter sp. Tf4]
MFPRKISAIAKEHSVKLILAHGVLAGALAYKVWRRTDLPFYVSSFEPHADYMADSSVWGSYSLKYRIQKYWEHKQQKLASGLITVTHAYRECLIQDRVQAAKVKTVCSPVQTTEFEFDSGSRDGVRKQLNWQTATIGIYTGKYGGLYYNEEAFQIYQKCFELIPDFRLIILSPQPEGEILQQLQKHDINQKKVFIASVPHEEVPMYLSAADFGFATYKLGPSKKYLSPVKVGEYWANGLPVLLTEGVGDEGEIIKQEGGGALFNLQQPGSLERAIQQIQMIIQDPAHRQQIPALAVKYRSPERVREAYAYFFNQQLSGK